MTQQSHCWAYTPRKPELKETHVPPMFITALFTIARTWKQPRCPSADAWIRKLWYIYTMKYYSAVKKNTFESVLMRWEGLGAGGEGDDRGWDGWMASLTRWSWVWVNARSWWWTGRPGVLQLMGSQSQTRLSNWTELNEVDEPRAYCTEWSKKEKDKYCILMHVYGI